jgi:transketolase
MTGWSQHYGGELYDEPPFLTREAVRWLVGRGIDQLIDLLLNYRQSGHPGGSRSKVHALIVTLLSGVMRWDIRHPEKRFGDRFILGAAPKQPAPIVALHLTRPPIEIPDRAKLGMPSHFEAARGAYVVRDYRPDQPRGGTVIVQGTSAMATVVNVLPELDEWGLNVKIVCATSPQLFALQPEAYRQQVLSPADWGDSTIITTQARWLMHDWLFNKVAEEYALSGDWDGRWCTGGTLDELIDEAHLSPRWVLAGIERFVRDRDARMASNLSYMHRRGL